MKTQAPQKQTKCGNPPISKVEILAETVAWRSNCKVSGSTEGGSTSDKFRIGGGGSGVIVIVTGKIIFVRGANTAMKINSAIAGDSETGRRNSLLGSGRRWSNFMLLKPGSRVKTFGGKSKMHDMQRRHAPLWSPQSSNNKFILTYSPDGCGLATMLRNTYLNADSPRDQWQTC